jgi:hypothetical protein
MIEVEKKKKPKEFYNFDVEVFSPQRAYRNDRFFSNPLCSAEQNKDGC